MSSFIGRRASVGIAKESTRGTPVNPAFWIPFTSVDFNDKVEQVNEEAAFAQLADTDSNYVTGKYGEGAIEAEIRDKALGLILTGLMGASPTTTGSGPYTHTYTLQDTSNQHQSLSILVQDPNGATMFPLAMVDSFEITVEPLGIVKYTVNFTSQGGRDWTSQLPNFTSLGEKFLHYHLETKVAANIADLGAASILSLKSLTFTVEKNPIRDFKGNTIQPDDIFNQQISVEGELKLNYNDRTWRDYMLNGTYRAMEIKLNGGVNSSLTFQLPRVSFNSWEPDYGLNDISTETISFKAHYDSANALKIISTCTLVNQQASGSY